MRNFIVFFMLCLGACFWMGFQIGPIAASSAPFQYTDLLGESGVLVALSIAIWWFVRDRKQLISKLDAANKEILKTKDEEIESLKEQIKALEALVNKQ